MTSPNPSIEIVAGNLHTTLSGDRTIAIGRDPGNDIVLNDPLVSARHAALEPADGGWALIDLNSTNGTWFAGTRVDHVPVTPTRPCTVHLGGPDLNPITLRPAATGQGTAPVPIPAPAPVPTAATILVGRAAHCDLALSDPLVSREHIRIQAGPQPSVQDLGSFNGTLLNGTPLSGTHALSPDDLLEVGNTRLRWNGSTIAVDTSESAFQARNITVEVKGGAVLLDQVSLSLEPRSLTAVIGPSGAGKSTLLSVLTGQRAPSGGSVIWQGRDLIAHLATLRSNIGLVPQQDIQHPQLVVRRALEFSARLRLPPDTSAPERQARVDAVMAQMQLTGRQDKRIGTQLSGGQKKRVSIATELLTAPPLLFLDEPTSGLDPALDHDVMAQLRALADDGRVVVTVTHSTLALDMCDRILVLAAGGVVAYFGPPDGVFAHFGVDSYRGVFEALARGTFTSTPSMHVEPAPPPAGPPTSRPGPPFLSQLRTFAARTMAVAFADPMLIGMLVAMPVLLALLAHIVPGGHGLAILKAPPNSPEATQRLTILTVGACLMGLALTIRELVKERPIFDRERAVGMSVSAYWLAKVTVFGLLATVQGALFAALALFAVKGPDAAGIHGWGRLEIVIPVALTTAAMAIAGLCLSALVSNSEQAMPALVGMVMVQLVLSGALVTIVGRAGLEQLAWFAPSRWGYAATGASIGLNTLRERTDQVIDPLFDHSRQQWLLDVGAVTLLGFVMVAGGLLLLRWRRSR